MSQQINLLEPSLLPRRDWFNGMNISIGMTLMIAFMVFHWGLETHLMHRLMASSTPAVPGDPALQLPADEMERELAEGQVRLTRGEMLMEAVAGLTDLPVRNAERLRRMVGSLPETAWLQEVEFVGRSGVRIVGGVLQADALSDFSRQLRSDPSFRGLPIRSFLLDAKSRGKSDEAERPAEVEAPRYGFVLSSLEAGPNGTAVAAAPAQQTAANTFGQAIDKAVGQAFDAGRGEAPKETRP